MVELVLQALRLLDQTVQIVYSGVRQLPLVAEEEEVSGRRRGLGPLEERVAGARIAEGRGHREVTAAAVRGRRRQAAEEAADHQVKTERPGPVKLEEAGETERPTRGVTSAQRAQLMGVGVGGSDPTRMGRVGRAGAETREIPRPPVLIFMAVAEEGLMALKPEATEVLDTSLCASHGRFKRDTKISLTIKSWQRLIQK